MPTIITPEEDTFWGTLGTQSLLPTLAAICNRILVSTVCTPFLLSVEVTVTWLFFSIPALSIIFLRLLQLLLKPKGMMNQNMFVSFQHSCSTSFQIIRRACRASLNRISWCYISHLRAKLALVEEKTARAELKSRSGGQITAIFRGVLELKRGLLYSWKLAARFYSILSFPPNYSTGKSSCFAFILLGLKSIQMPSLSAMTLGLKLSLAWLNWSKMASISFIFWDGGTIVKSDTSLRLRSSKSSGSPLISNNSGTRTIPVSFSLSFLGGTAFSSGWRLLIISISYISRQYQMRFICLPLWLKEWFSMVDSNITDSITQQRFLPQLAITILPTNSYSTANRFSSFDDPPFILQMLFITYRTVSPLTILTAEST